MTEEYLADMAAAERLPGNLEVDEFWEFCLAGNDVQPWLHVPCTVETLRSMPAEARERMGCALRAAAAAPRLADKVRRLQAERDERDELLSHYRRFRAVDGGDTVWDSHRHREEREWLAAHDPAGVTLCKAVQQAGWFEDWAQPEARARELAGEGEQ